MCATWIARTHSDFVAQLEGYPDDSRNAFDVRAWQRPGPRLISFHNRRSGSGRAQTRFAPGDLLHVKISWIPQREAAKYRLLWKAPNGVAGAREFVVGRGLWNTTMRLQAKGALATGPWVVSVLRESKTLLTGRFVVEAY